MKTEEFLKIVDEHKKVKSYWLMSKTIPAVD